MRNVVLCVRADVRAVSSNVLLPAHKNNSLISLSRAGHDIIDLRNAYLQKKQGKDY